MRDDEKIAFVIPYVNGDDPVWREAFIQAGGVYDDSKQHGWLRYRDNGTCELLLDSIDRFAPWADVYMVLAMPSQIPEYAKDRNIKFIYHSDFLPENLKPCVFTSNAIESFLGRMNLPEYFVWLNDDIIFTKPLLPSDFYDEAGVPKYLVAFTEPSGLWSDPWVLPCYECIFQNCMKPKRVVTLHGPTPFRYSWCEEMYKTREEFILNGIGSKVSREKGQICQYAYSIYNYFYKELKDDALFGISICGEEKNILDFLDNVSWICINEKAGFDAKKMISKIKLKKT